MGDGVVTGLVAIALLLTMSPIVGWASEKIARAFRRR